jgi:hypothetical protein
VHQNESGACRLDRLPIPVTRRIRLTGNALARRRIAEKTLACAAAEVQELLLEAAAVDRQIREAAQILASVGDVRNQDVLLLVQRLTGLCDQLLYAGGEYLRVSSALSARTPSQPLRSTSATTESTQAS